MTASITSLGIGSGVDVNAIVTQLVALESRPIGQLRSQASELQTRVSSYGQLSSLFGALQTAANKLTGSSLWASSRASTSNEASVQVVGGNAAAPGNYSVEVTTLAAQQTLVSGARLASPAAPAGSGVMTLDIGQWDYPPMNFLPQVGRDPVSIVVTAEDTLATLRDKINGAGAGVTASIVTDSGGARLALRAAASGEQQAVRVSVADDDGGAANDGLGLSRFAFDPEHGSAGMTQEVPGRDADARVNGIRVLSASNDLDGVVDGLTLRLRSPGSSAEVSVSSDRDAVKAAVQDFATAYNNLARTIAEQTRYDPASEIAGPLQGDSAATGLQRQMRSLLGAGSLASASFQRLSDVGLSLQRDGTLAVDAARLDRATGDLAELKKAFANSDADPQRDGFARRYADLAQQVLGVDGSLTTRTDGLRQRIAANQAAQTAQEERVERFRARLVAQYTAMDGNVSRLNALSSYVTQQLAALDNANSANRR